MFQNFKTWLKLRKSVKKTNRSHLFYHLLNIFKLSVINCPFCPDNCPQSKFVGQLIYPSCTRYLRSFFFCCFVGSFFFAQIQMSKFTCAVILHVFINLYLGIMSRMTKEYRSRSKNADGGKFGITTCVRSFIQYNFNPFAKICSTKILNLFTFSAS